MSRIMLLQFILLAVYSTTSVTQSGHSPKYTCPAISSGTSAGVKELALDGDVILGGLFPVHKRSKTAEHQCDKIDLQPGYQFLDAMLFALEEINNDTNILPNITLGAKIYDTCRSQTIGMDRAKDFIKYTLFPESEKTPPLAGVIGAFRSDVSIAVSNLLRVFGIPQVSFGSTSPDLSNKNIYGNFLRTVPPDSFQSQALVDIVRHFGWTYVMAVYSDGNFPEKGMEMFLREAKKSGLCIAEKIKLPAFPKDEDYINTVEKLLEIKSARGNSAVGVAVIFCVQRDNKGLVKAANILFPQKSEHITWIASITWGNRADVTNGNEIGGEGAITMSFHRGNENKFRKYFLNSGLENTAAKRNPWLEEFWQQQLKCRLSNASTPLKGSTIKECTANAKIPQETEIVPVGIVINAVFAFAHALDKMRKDLCPTTAGLCSEMKEKMGSLMLGYLKNVSFHDPALDETFQFNKNGEVNGKYGVFNFKKVGRDYQYVKVASWSGALTKHGSIKGTLDFNGANISWGRNSSNNPVSYCSKPCELGQVMRRETTNANCCWYCVKCKSNEIIVNNTCVLCQQGYMPNNNQSLCLKLPIHYPNLGEVPAKILTALAILGLLGTISTAIGFAVYSEHPVIKATGKELNVTLFIGVSLCYIAVMLWLLKPSRASCAARRFLGGVSLTTCYAPIYLRTTRIYRIVTAAKKTTRRPSFVTPKTQVFAASSLIGVQGIIEGVVLVASPPTVRSVYSHVDVVLECESLTIHVITYLTYNLLLLLAITVLAFRTRKYPRNFNEAKYIGVSAYISCSVWIIIFPCYLNIEDGFVKAYLASTSLFLVATIILCSLLVPKIFLIRRNDPEKCSSFVPSKVESNNDNSTTLKNIQHTTV